MARGRKKKITDVDELIRITEEELAQLNAERNTKRKELRRLKKQKEELDQQKILDLVKSSGLSYEEAKRALFISEKDAAAKK